MGVHPPPSRLDQCRWSGELLLFYRRGSYCLFGEHIVHPSFHHVWLHIAISDLVLDKSLPDVQVFNLLGQFLNCLCLGSVHLLQASLGLHLLLPHKTRLLS